MDKKVLNLEMLRIAGFTCTGGIWSYPDGVDVDNGVPFFPEDETACFKWLVPRVTKLGYEVRIITAFEGYVVGILRHSNCDIVASDNNTIAALAFCLAIEKLIRGEQC